MDTNYLLIFALLLGCLATTVPVFMALFFTGTVGLVFGLGIDPQIVIEVVISIVDSIVFDLITNGDSVFFLAI